MTYVNNPSTTPNSPVVPTEGSATETNQLSGLIAQWYSAMSGPMSQEKLLSLLDNLETALEDPEMAGELEKAGITKETISGLREGLADGGEINHNAWFALFSRLEVLTDTGAFSFDGEVKKSFINFGIREIAQDVSEANDEVERHAAVLEIGIELDALPSDEHGNVTISADLIERMIAVGITADDVSNDKLKALLNGEDPANVAFTKEEIIGISGDVGARANEEASGVAGDLLTRLKGLQNVRDELIRMESEIHRKVHDLSMKINDFIANA